jgi:hypothetical protein
MGTISSLNTTPSGPSRFSNTLYCAIDTSKVTGEIKVQLTAGRIRAMEGEVRKEEDHDNWRCRAVTVDPKNPKRVRIACRDEAEHQPVKQTAELHRAFASCGMNSIRSRSTL